MSKLNYQFEPKKFYSSGLPKVTIDTVILAGGFGTRLRSVVQDVPKPMAPINGRPFLEYLFSYLERQGITKVIVATHYQSEKIISFGNKYGGVSLNYFVENTPLGTGGAIKEALQYISNKNILVLNGDTFLSCDYKKMFEQHVKTNADVTIAIRKIDAPGRYSIIQFNDELQVTEFNTTINPSRDTSYINGGTYIIKSDIFKDCPQTGAFSFETDILSKQVNIKKIFCYICTDYFIDIGIPEDFHRAQTELPNQIKLNF